MRYTVDGWSNTQRAARINEPKNHFLSLNPLINRKRISGVKTVVNMRGKTVCNPPIPQNVPNRYRGVMEAIAVNKETAGAFNRLSARIKKKIIYQNAQKNIIILYETRKPFACNSFKKTKANGNESINPVLIVLRPGREKMISFFSSSGFWIIDAVRLYPI
ncbi:MAG: hypothetical protein HQ593_04550 [Candidatus Omnitrophica bacterium]|nr:hypothetical protein [Candidatus Omnitrophota bacterium]